MAKFGRRKSGQVYPKGGRKAYTQTGRSDTAVDRKLGAKLPGWRRSSKGNKYFERRRNRSDKKGSSV